MLDEIAELEEFRKELGRLCTVVNDPRVPHPVRHRTAGSVAQLSALAIGRAVRLLHQRQVATLPPADKSAEEA